MQMQVQRHFATSGDCPLLVERPAPVGTGPLHRKETQEYSLDSKCPCCSLERLLEAGEVREGMELGGGRAEARGRNGPRRGMELLAETALNSVPPPELQNLTCDLCLFGSVPTQELAQI